MMASDVAGSDLASFLLKCAQGTDRVQSCAAGLVAKLSRAAKSDAIPRDIALFLAALKNDAGKEEGRPGVCALL
jgi:hypothetical protein